MFSRFEFRGVLDFLTWLQIVTGRTYTVYSFIIASLVLTWESLHPLSSRASPFSICSQFLSSPVLNFFLWKLLRGKRFWIPFTIFFVIEHSKAGASITSAFHTNYRVFTHLRSIIMVLMSWFIPIAPPLKAICICNQRNYKKNSKNFHFRIKKLFRLVVR